VAALHKQATQQGVATPPLNVENVHHIRPLRA